MRARIVDLLAFGLAVLAAHTSATISSQVFERIPHVEDEFANLWQAEVMAQGRLTLPSPRYPKNFVVPFVVDYQGQRFGKYSPGWPAALSLGVRLEAPWLVNALLAGLGVWLVYQLGSKVAGNAAGILAAILTASSPMFLMLSGSLMSHPMSLVLSVASCLAWLELFPDSTRDTSRVVSPALLGVVCGSSLGLLVLTRPLTAIGISAPFAFHGLAMLLKGSRAQRRFVLLVGAVTISLGALIFLWQAALTGDPFKNPYTLWWDYDRIGFGPGHGRTETGHTLQLANINTRFSLRAGKHDLFGWPQLSWLFLPFGLIALRRKRDAWLLFASAPILVLIYAAYWIGAWLFGPRYYYEALPALAIISASGVVWLASWGETASKLPRLRLGLTGFVFTLLVSLNLLYYAPIRVGGMRGLYGIRRAGMDPLLEQELEGALVFVHADHWTQYGALLTLAPPFAERDLLLVWTNSSKRVEAVTEAFPDRTIYHYDPATSTLFSQNPY